MKVVVHVGDLGIERIVVGWILKQWTIRALATVMLFSIESTVGLLCGMERNSSVSLVARLRLDSRENIAIDGRGQRCFFFETSRLDQRPTQPPAAVSTEILQQTPKFNQTLSFS